MWRVSSVLSLNGLSVPRKFSDDAKERGTAVHGFVEHHAHGERLPRALYKSNTAPFIHAAERWFNDFAPTVLFTERRVTSTVKRLTGRIDLGVLLGNDAIVVDVKTGGQAPWHGVQVCGYVDLATESPELTEILLAHTLGPWQRGVLYLHDDGTYRWFGPLDLLKAGPHDAYLFRAAHALVCWKFDKGYLHVTDSAQPEEDR